MRPLTARGVRKQWVVSHQERAKHSAHPPNPALAAVDRGAFLGRLMLSGFEGKVSASEILARIEELRTERAAERIKGYPNLVYLVVEAYGDVTSAPKQDVRDLGTAVFGFSVVDKAAITARFQSLVNAAITAFLLKGNIATEAMHVLDGVELTLPDGRPLYSFTASLSAPRFWLGRPANVKDVRNFEQMLPALLANEGLAAPSRLLVEALRKRNDHLESFILGWAALEMVIGKHTVHCENGEWVRSVPEKLRAAAEANHETYRTSGRPRYPLADRLRVLMLALGSSEWDTTAVEFTRLRTTYREPLYHEGRFEESSLPVDAVIKLVRWLMDGVANKALGGS